MAVRPYVYLFDARAGSLSFFVIARATPEAIFFYTCEKPFPKTHPRMVEVCFAGKDTWLAMT
jgi:hypothetical protein